MRSITSGDPNRSPPRRTSHNQFSPSPLASHITPFAILNVPISVSFYLGFFSWLVDPPAEAFCADVQIGYSHQAAPGMVEPLADDRVQVRFDAGQTAITRGQAAVFYDGEAVIGRGSIE